MRQFAYLVFGGAGFIASFPAFATTYTPVDVSSFVGTNVGQNPGGLPTGTTTGNRGTGIPFDISNKVKGLTTSYIAPYGGGAVLDVSGLSIVDPTTAYALLNNYFGKYGANEYTITFKTKNGDTAAFNAVGGLNTRDYNAAGFVNTVSSPATTTWFADSTGQRLDVRTFVLPASFATETVSDFIITQLDPRDVAVFTGLTFASASAVPEPASLGILGVAAAGLLGLRRRT